MEISNRLKTLASLVTKGNVACDVGTDHGYLAIYLVENEICPKVIAMDVAKGPLSKAQHNIAQQGLQDRIETRLSDGVAKLEEGEASTVIIAGMGGILINTLLENGKKILGTMEEIILSPHTDVELVRRYLLEHQYQIAEEQMLIEEEKYYNILKVHPKETNERIVDEQDAYSQCEEKFGRYLLQHKNQVLLQYLSKELEKKKNILEKLSVNLTENASKRCLELQAEIQCIEEGMRYYEV